MKTIFFDAPKLLNMIENEELVRRMRLMKHSQKKIESEAAKLGSHRQCIWIMYACNRWSVRNEIAEEKQREDNKNVLVSGNRKERDREWREGGRKGELKQETKKSNRQPKLNYDYPFGHFPMHIYVYLEIHTSIYIYMCVYPWDQFTFPQNRYTFSVVYFGWNISHSPCTISRWVFHSSYSLLRKCKILFFCIMLYVSVHIYDKVEIIVLYTGTIGPYALNANSFVLILLFNPNWNWCQFSLNSKLSSTTKRSLSISAWSVVTDFKFLLETPSLVWRIA